jgi:hypothetical protein
VDIRTDVGVIFLQNYQPLVFCVVNSYGKCDCPEISSDGCITMW